MTKRDQPHDRYFRDLLHDIDLAKRFLLHYLSKDIREGVDWSTLSLYDASVTGEANKQLYADLVYKALTKDHQHEAFFILNHQRKPDQLLPIRGIEYILGTLKKTVKQKLGKPRLITQITLYNGKTYPYPYAQSIFEYFEDPELAEKFFLQSQQIICLHEKRDEDLGDPEDILEIFMKQADNPKLLTWMEENATLVNKLSGHKYWQRSLDYVTDVGPHKLEDILATLEKISPKLKEDMLTTAQQLRREGRKEGRQEGMETKAMEIAKNMLLQLGLDMDLVHKATGLSQEELEKLKKDAAKD